MHSFPDVTGFSTGLERLKISAEDKRKAEKIISSFDPAGIEALVESAVEGIRQYRHYERISHDAKWEVLGDALQLTAWIICRDPLGEKSLRLLPEPLRENFFGAHPSRIAVYLTVSDSAATRRNYKQVIEQLLHLGVSRADFAALRGQGYTIGKLAAEYRLRINGNLK